MHFRHELLLVMAFECYESDQQISEILNKIDEVVMGMKTDLQLLQLNSHFRQLKLSLLRRPSQITNTVTGKKKPMSWNGSRDVFLSLYKLDNCPLFFQGLKWYFNFKGAVQIDFFLRDGVRICQLMNKIKAESINKQDIITGNIEAHKNNIQHFIEAAGKYGVPDKYLFQVKWKYFIEKVKTCEQLQG